MIISYIARVNNYTGSMNLRKPFAAILLVIISVIPSFGQELLPRRPFIGLDMEPLSISQKQKLELGTDVYGIYVKGTLPGSPASIAGFKENDVIVMLEDKKVASPQELLYALRELNNNATVDFEILRDSNTKHLKVKLIPFPKEENDKFSTIYTAVQYGTNTQRVIITKPKSGTNFPAVLLLQGVGCFSQDNMSYPAIRQLVDSLTLSGFAVMRVEKSGIGDSKGKPCNETNLEDEVSGYLAGLRLLKQQSYVDTSNIYLVGFSVGSIVAPILNLQESVKGIVVYGTLGRNWFEYELLSTRRQYELSGRPMDSLDNFMRKEYNRLYGLFVSQASPTDIVEKYPWTADNMYVYPMSFPYFQQIAMIDITSLWLRTNAYVLTIHGSSDYVTDPNDHEQIAKLINSKYQGKGQYIEIQGIDHWLNKAQSPKESYFQLGGTFEPRIIPVITNYITEKSNMNN